MARKRVGEVGESVDHLRALLKRSRGRLWAPRLKMILHIAQHPNDTLRSIGVKLNYSERQIRRWWKTYQDSGLERMIGTRVDDVTLGEISRSTSRYEQNDGNSVPRYIRDFLNGLPLTDDWKKWVEAMREGLKSFLGDVDRILITVNLACDLHDLDNNDANLHLIQHLSGRASRRDAGAVSSQMGSGNHGENLLKDLRKQGFPLQLYHRPTFFEYYIEEKAYVGTIFLFRRKELRPISPETIGTMEGLRPFLAFALSDCLARRRPDRLDPQGFSEIVEAIGEAEELSPRQTQVLFHLLLGQKHGEIAAHLGIKEDTVTKHATAIHSKAGVKNAGELFARHMTPARK